MAPTQSAPVGVAPRIVQNHTLDSTRWRDFDFRPDDIVIASWAKAGTTWLQQIVSQLLFGNGRQVSLWDVSPWIENRLYSRKQMYRRLAAQTHRRFVKTHLPADALPWSELARYIYICRDGRDVAWSWYHHHLNLSPAVYEVINGLGGRVGPPFVPPVEPFNEFFRLWLERDGFPLWPFWSHVASWWQVRGRCNVLLLRYEELKADLPGQVRRLAHFLELGASDTDWDEIAAHCSFDYMKRHADALLPSLQEGMQGGGQSFLRQGAIEAWRGSLSPENLRLYADYATRLLPPDCLCWLAASHCAAGSPPST